MKNYSILKLIFILTPFVFSFALGLDIYIPIVPQMTQLFDTSPAMVQLTLSLFMLVTGIGQVFVGPLADRFGRKFVFYLASACFALGSLGCAMSTHISWLIAARVVSAFGACGMLVTAFAIVRDLFSKEESAKIYSFLNGAIGISPTFAPIIGGYLAVYFGWQSIFFFLTLIGILSFLVCNRFIHETIEPHQRVKIDKTIFKRYYSILRNPQFIVNTFISGFAEAVFFCFFSISPFIIVEVLGVPTHQFGYYFAAFGAVIALGGLASGKVIEMKGIAFTMGAGIALMFAGGSAMLVWSFLAPLSLQSFLIPMVVACTGAMFLVGGAASEALEPFEETAGTAAAAFGAIQFSTSATVGTLLMLFPTTSTVPYGVCIVLLAIVCTVFFSIRSKEELQTI